MKVIQRALDWLKQEGYAPQEEEKFLVVKYQGLNYLIPDTEEDETFLKVDLVFPFSAYEQLTSQEALTLANKVSQEIKIAKATVREDAMIYTTEVLVCASDDFGTILPRLFDTLQVAARYFYEQHTQK